MWLGYTPVIKIKYLKRLTYFLIPQISTKNFMNNLIKHNYMFVMQKDNNYNFLMKIKN